MEDYPIQISGKKCLDIGASTGGFTEILLENGAASVYAVDVGSMQLSEELKNNNLVKSFENTDIRDFKPESVFEIVSVDLSFVSTKELLPIIVPLSSDVIIILFKPQFEVGKNAKRDKKGVVTDTTAIMRAIFDFELEAKAFGLDVLYKAPCKFAGKEGNQEYFYVFKVCL
jgi:23S rRNA (cytidine1920-2'-O)/16S rRNA (cytidine1409-2'-O)-methyltransferase